VKIVPGADIHFRGEPLQWGAKYTGWEKFAIFHRKRRFILEMVWDRPMVTIECLLEVICALSNDDIFNDLHGPLSQFSRSRHFLCRISQKLFWPLAYRQELLLKSNRKPNIVYRMVPFSITLSDLWPWIQGHDIFWSWILKNGATWGQSYYSTLIGNHT